MKSCLVGALFLIVACGHAPPKKTSGLEVLSMCGGFYTAKALASEKSDVATSQVDKFLDECRQAATDEVCSHYACLITQSTEARIQRDLDAKPGTTTPGTTFKRRPRQLSQDPVNFTLAF